MSKYCYKCEKDVELVKDSASNAQLCKICGAILIHSASKLPRGTILSGFQIIEEIGRGGMGIVYRAKQLNLERNVALKVLADDLAKDDEFVENFFKEARAAASLNHPNIVQVFDAGSTPEGIYYFAMELIVGETLETKIERDGAMDSKEAMRVAVKIADALDYAWESQKLTHGDIKPDNIIIDGSGGAKLADLGLAKFMHDETSDTGVMATPLYAPPEIIKGDSDKIGCQSDMYSFGATLFQMLAGVPPFPDDLPEVVLKKHLKDSPPLLSNYNPRFAPTLVQLINQLMEKAPSERPFSWSDISKALKKIKEPEVEGKIFHTHHHEHEDKEPIEVVEEEPKKNFKPLIGLLVAIVVGLLIAISFVIIGGKNIKEIEQDDLTSPLPNNLRSEDAQKELEVIKSQLKFLTPEQAVEQFEKILKKYGRLAPVEATVLRDKYKKQYNRLMSQAVKVEKERTRFSTALAKLKKDIKATAISNPKTPIKTIQSLSKRIESVLQQASKKSYLKISAVDRAQINAAYLTLSSRIMKYNQELKKIALREAAEEKLRQLEEKKEKRAAQENKRLEGLSENSTIDNYYQILAEYLDNKNLSGLNENLAKWSSSSKSIPAAYSVRVNFLQKSVIPKYENFVSLIIKHSDLLTGKPLPISVCPTKYRKYKVKEVDETGIKLLYSEGKVSMGYTLKWSKMPAKVIGVIVQERLFNNPERKKDFSSKEHSTTLSYLVLKAPTYCEEIINQAKLKKREKRMWNYLSSDVMIAEDENKLISQYQEFCKAYKSKDFDQASELFVKLKKSSSLTAFGKRYAAELTRIEQSMMAINPAIPAQLLIYEYSAIPKIANNPTKLFNACMVAEARYANILDEKSREKLNELKAQSLQQLVEESGITQLNANRIPFYYWDMEKTGTSWAYYQVVKDSGKMAQTRILSSMELAAALDNGDWALAKKIFDSDEALSIAGLEQMKKTYNWASSFIFARGMMDLQYGNGNRRQEALTTLIRISQNQRIPAMKPLATALAMEYALLTKQHSRAIDLVQQYQFNMGPMAKMEARVALLNILAMMEKDSSNHKNIRQAIKKYTKAFRNIPNMKHGDSTWCNLAMDLCDGNLKPANIKSLRGAKCDFPDISARILISALARYLCTQQNALTPQTETELMEIIRRQIRSIFVANETWKKYTILKIALKKTPGGMSREADNSLKDCRISTTGFYPGLLMLKAGAEFADNKYSAKEAKLNLEKFLEASVVASSNDLKILDVISAGAPGPLVSKLYVRNLPDKAYIGGVMGMMFHYQNPNTRSSIVRILNENYNLLSWEERFLVKQIQTW